MQLSDKKKQKKNKNKMKQKPCTMQTYVNPILT